MVPLYIQVYSRCKTKDKGEGCCILSVLQTSGEGTFGIAGAMLSDCQHVHVHVDCRSKREIQASINF